MPITSTDITDQILLETGDIDPTTGDAPVTVDEGLVFQNLDRLWLQYAAKDQVAPGLRALYVKRAALRMILANLAQKRFDVSDVLAGLTLKASAIWQHFSDLHEDCKAEIKALEASVSANGGPRGGRLTTRAPIVAAHPPDANDLHYGGSPYRGRRYCE